MDLVPVLFTFYIQGVLKLKKNNSGAKRLRLPRQWVKDTESNGAPAAVTSFGTHKQTTHKTNNKQTN